MKILIISVVATFLSGYNNFLNVEKLDKYPTQAQLESFIREGVSIYHQSVTGTFVTHINIKSGDNFTRIEIVGANTDKAFKRVHYQQIRSYGKGYLVIESNTPSYFKQKLSNQKALRKEIIPKLIVEEQEIHSDSSITEIHHVIYDPPRLLLHYDGTKLTIKQFLVE